jgi:NADH-quinone oxidoreductase subunit N
MSATNMDFLAVAPIVALSVGALAVLLVDIMWRPRPVVWGALAGASLFAAGVALVVQWTDVVGDGGEPDLFFSGMLAVDGYSVFAGLLVIAVAALGLAGAWPLVKSLERRGAEFVSLLLVAAAGMHLMAGAADLVFVFLSLEVMSISLYVLAGFTRDRADADESALKYFLLGSFASAVFLYGVALFFASTGTTSLYGGRDFLTANVVLSPGVLLIGMGLMIVGLGFKVSAAPFHMWAPDVYQGAPGGVAGFMNAAAKVGGFAALARLLAVPLTSYIDDWAPVVAVIAAISVVVGTVLAIAQADFKRMLAYSSVAHAGFMLTALVAGGEGIPDLWFYLATYVVLVVGAFTVAAIVTGPSGGRSALTAYAGLGKRSPMLALTLMTLMLAMGGIPLTTGFVGKVAVFQAAIDADYLWLVIVGLLSATAGLFFYLRVIVLMYFQEPALAEAPGAATAAPEPTGPQRVTLLSVVAVTVAFGIVPWPLLEAAADALPF